MFLTIEGIDGCGKTTQTAELARCLEQLGQSVLQTREPGGWGDESIRRLLLAGGFSHPLTEFALFCADRFEHLARVIEPALRAGRTVICDRYADSTVAYQMFGRGLKNQEGGLAGLTDSFRQPDVTFYLSLEPEVAWARRGAQAKTDAFEREGLEFQRRVKEGFDWLAAQDRRRRIEVIDGSLPPEQVTDELLKALRCRGLIR